MDLTLKPGDELFIGASDDKRKAYAHIGVREGCLVVIDAPFQTHLPSPFNYGNGLTTVPLEETNVGMQFKIRYWGEYEDPMFTLQSVNQADGTATLALVDGLKVMPRDGTDHPLTAFND